MFYCCDLLFIHFCTLIFEAEERRPAGPLPECRNVVWFYNRDQGVALSVSLHFEGRKSANFAPQLGDGATLNSCNLKTRLQIEKLKQMHETTFLSNHNCKVLYTLAL